VLQDKIFFGIIPKLKKSHISLGVGSACVQVKSKSPDLRINRILSFGLETDKTFTGGMWIFYATFAAGNYLILKV
jgi:hypothetical protein